MDYSCEWIALERIDAADVRYRITTPQDKPGLEASIARIGLTSPVTVKEEAGRFILVSGFRRVEACRQLGWPQLTGRVLPVDTAASVCVEIAIAENLTQRALNVVEQARCLHLLSTAHLEPGAAERIADALGLSLNRNLTAKLAAVLSTPVPVQNGLVTGTIGLPTALSLAQMPPEDAEAIARLFTMLPMGLNKQRELLSFLCEIAARDDLPLQTVLSDNAVQDVLAAEHLDGNQKSRRIRDYLRKRRYPRLTEVENAFQRCIGELALGKNIQMTPPPGFEGRTCAMTIRFDSLQDLKQAHRKIGEVIDHPMTACLFDL